MVHSVRKKILDADTTNITFYIRKLNSKLRPSRGDSKTVKEVGELLFTKTHSRTLVHSSDAHFSPCTLYKLMKGIHSLTTGERGRKTFFSHSVLTPKLVHAQSNMHPTAAIGGRTIDILNGVPESPISLNNNRISLSQVKPALYLGP